MLSVNIPFLVIVGSLLFACGYTLGVWHKTVNPELFTEGGDELFFAQPVETDSMPMPIMEQRKSDKTETGRYPCCDHCYLPTGELSHEAILKDQHPVACREWSLNPNPTRGNTRIYCQGY